MPSAGTWIRAVVGGLVVCIGGPALIVYVSPTEEELFKRYNPELQKRSLEGREERLREANEFVAKMKEYSKSDKPIWTVWKEAEAADKLKRIETDAAANQERKRIAEELRRERLDGK